MAAAAIVAGIGVAVSAAGTAAAISAQQRQARAQEEASLQSALDAEERIEVAMQRSEAIKQSAKLIRDRELAVVGAQRQQAELDITQQFLNNRLAQIQSELQVAGMRASGESSRLDYANQATQVQQGAESEAFEIERGAQNQLAGKSNEVVGALNQQTESNLQGANALAQANQGFQQVNQVGNQIAASGRGNSLAGISAQEAALLGVQGTVGNVNMGNQQRSGVAAFNVGQAEQSMNMAQRQLALAQKYGLTNVGLSNQYAKVLNQAGVNQQTLADLGAQAVSTQQRYANINLEQSAQGQRNVNALQAQRNRRAIKAGYQSTLATQDLSALSQVLQEKANISQALAQSNQIQYPGASAYLGVLANGVSAAYQLGVFGQGGSGQITGYPPSGPATRQVPSITFGQPLNTINQYPPSGPATRQVPTVNYGQSLRINQYPPGY